MVIVQEGDGCCDMFVEFGDCLVDVWQVIGFWFFVVEKDEVCDYVWIVGE